MRTLGATALVSPPLFPLGLLCALCALCAPLACGGGQAPAAGPMAPPGAGSATPADTTAADAGPTTTTTTAPSQIVAVSTSGASATYQVASASYRLSLSATGHGPVKAMILDLDAKKAQAMMMPLLDAPSGSVSIRQKLTEFAEAEGLSL